MTHSELERELDEEGRELLRCFLQAHMDLRSPGEAQGAVRDAEGVERIKTAAVHKRDLASVFGSVEVRRVGYGAEGEESLHPLDGELNLPPERYSHELRRRAAEEAAKGSFDEAVETLARHTGTKVPKRQLEELVARAAEDFDAFYEQRSATAGTAPGSLMVLSFDAKGVVMHFQDLREATRKAAAKRKHKHKRRLSKGEKRNAKRMAQVATVYTVAPRVRTPEHVMRCMAPIHEVESKNRPRPESKRVWASVRKEPEEVIEEAFEEALKRDPRREKKWFVLVDGNKTQLKIVKELQQEYAVALTVVIDIIHVSEYLWKAAIVFHAEGTAQREEWVSQRLLEVLRGRSSHVAGGIRRSATLRGLVPEEREAADDCADYLIKYSSYLRYDQYLAAGAPIATGVIEGACRHLVKDRMFDEYWRFHEAREYQRNHTARYADHEVPATKKPYLQPSKPHLKLVK